MSSQTIHLLKCSQLLWLHSILYSQINTLCVMQKVITMAKKRNLNIRQQFNIGYGPKTDNVRHAVLLSLFFATGCSLIHEWLWQRGTVAVSRIRFSSFYGCWIFASSCQNSVMPSQPGNIIFCMECVRINKACFFCLNLKPLLFTSVETKRTWDRTDTRVKCEGWGWFKKEKKSKWIQGETFMWARVTASRLSPLRAVLWSADFIYLAPVDSLYCIVHSYLTWEFSVD